MSRWRFRGAIVAAALAVVQPQIAAAECSAAALAGLPKNPKLVSQICGQNAQFICQTKLGVCAVHEQLQPGADCDCDTFQGRLSGKIVGR
jgi:hypothetical protein